MLESDFQQLANRHAAAVKRIRIIRKSGSDIVIEPDKDIMKVIPQLLGVYKNDFDTMTAKYAGTIREVRVILRNDAGASQFFPKGTPDHVIWSSTVSKEELEA